MRADGLDCAVVALSSPIGPGSIFTVPSVAIHRVQQQEELRAMPALS
jgi:hypothetical protein